MCVSYLTDYRLFHAQYHTMCIIRTGSEGLCVCGGGGVTESRSFELSGASRERGVVNLCFLECISRHFEAHFSIFYNLNFK